MILTQYYLSCLSHGSYLIGDETTGQAVIVDPRRDITEYLDDAEAQHLDIVGVINTHVHADFVAGHLELAEATGAWIGYGSHADAEFDVRSLKHGDHISLGEVDLEILETPGHTWESISVLVRERAGDDIPAAVLTGDSMFIGGVGRPDLVVSKGSSADDLAKAMYSTIHDVLLALPDETVLYPAHGAGSSCGKNLSDDLDSTIGAQRRTNIFAQPMSEDEFVAMITTGQPAAPEYFAVDAALNLKKRPTLKPGEDLTPLSPAETRAALERGVKIIDTRSPEQFATGHLGGSINVGVDGRFAETAGMVVHEDDELVVVGDIDRVDEAGLRLSRIGFDRVVGYLADPANAFAELADLMVRTERLTAQEMNGLGSDAVVLDVRNPGEREDGAIPGSLHIPLAELGRRHSEVPEATEVIVHCASGWRSSVGASLLRSHGHSDVKDLLGGYNEWAESLETS
jgi:glyoxylase-like metal-dependent hydrolase (beta-lactamase superfamily II)/rhodanese-related sulfurtransferase